jgi:N-acetyl-gamma-glutamyl-phosphate reductase
MEHACPDLVKQAVYGLPEINRKKIRDAELVANPGCYPTVVQLGYLPLLEKEILENGSLIADAKSGVSGAGRKASVGTAYSEISESFKAYAASGHRHLPEIRQGLEQVAGEQVGLVFTPHLAPMIRGIHATLYGQLAPAHTDMSLQDLHLLFSTRFESEPFVDVMPPGSHPDTRSVRGSNLCRLAIHRPGDGNTIVVLAVEDNLVKGAAGQAIQNLNLMCGLEETCGLGNISLVP